MATAKYREKTTRSRAKTRFDSEQITALVLVLVGALLSLCIGFIPFEQRDQFLVIASGICSGAIGYLSRSFKDNYVPTTNYPNDENYQSEQNSDY